MKKPVFISLLSILAPAISPAQIPANATPAVRATGTAAVFVQPDQAIVDATVTTRAMTAQAAASQNATQTASVLSSLTQLLGSGANIKTVNYSVNPNYTFPPNGGTPTLVDFSASNTVEVTLSAVTTVGSVIDTAVQAGATSVGGIRFSLKDPEPSRSQALQQAAANAKAHANAMATALGRTVGTIVLLQENVTAQPVTATLGAAPTATTPILSGQIEVDASVVLEASLN